MPQILYNRFNRGVVDTLALTRLDVNKVQNTAALMENFIPIRLGPMSVAPGFDYLGEVPGPAIIIPFVRNIDETAVVELSDRLMRVWVDDTLVGREATAVPEIDDVTDWQDASEGGGQTVGGTASPPTTGGGPSAGSGTSTGGDDFSDEFEFEPPITSPVTAPPPDPNEFPTTNQNINGGVTFTGVTANGIGRRHTTIADGEGMTFAVRFIVARETVRVHIGTSGVSSNEIYSATLGQGVHSLLIDNPTADPTITIESVGQHTSVVTAVAVEAAGVMSIPTNISGDTLEMVRTYQIADRIFVAHPDGMAVIERRGRKSWSFVDYLPTNGPWGFVNDTNITMRTTALEGDMDILASANVFTQSDVGRLVRIASSSSNADTTVTGVGESSSAVRVTGEGLARELRVTVSGVYEGSVLLEQSVDEVTWTTAEAYAGQGPDVTTSYQQNYNDNTTGGLFFYRLTSGPDFDGEAQLLLAYAGGSIEGVARIVDFVSQTQVGARSILPFGSTTATPNWYFSAWSEATGWPSANTFNQGRLWWAGNDQVWGSESDDYFGFDRLRDGDARSILRTIGFGPVDSVLWLDVAQSLTLGLTTDEITLRASSFGEVVTQDNAHLRPGTSRGTACVPALRYNNRLYYPSRSGRRMMEHTPNSVSHDLRDLTYLNQDIGRPFFKRTAMTSDPETRIYAVRGDGTMAIALIDADEDVLGWSTRTLPFPARDVCALPQVTEDKVYALMETPDGWIMAVQGSLLDPHLHPLDLACPVEDCARLEGETVDVWDGQMRRATALTVTGGSVPSVAGAKAGYRITAKYTSNRLGGYVDDRSGRATDTERKRVTHVGLVIHRVLLDGLTFGPSADKMQPPTKRIHGLEPVRDVVTEGELDVLPLPFKGSYDMDSRVCIEATGPCTVALMELNIDTIRDQARNR